LKQSRLILGVYWLALVITTHWPRLGLPDAGSLGYDKLIHMAAFGLLAWLIGRAGARPLVAAGIAAAYAYLDECTQAIDFFGRVFSTSDLTANVVGVLIALAIMGTRDAAAFARFALVVLFPTGVMILFMSQSRFDVPEWLPPMGPHTGDIFELRFDRILHLMGGMVLTWLLSASRPFGRDHAGLSRGFAISVMVIGGALIELMQRHYGRGEEIGDLVSHELGVLIAVIIAAGYLLSDRHVVQRGDDIVPPPPVAPVKKEKTASFVGGAKVVSALTLLSRVAGLFRESVLAAVFGRGLVSDAFNFGFSIPNLFRRLFGEGALSAALIPVYAGLLERDRPNAERLVRVCVAWLMIILGLATLLGEVILAFLWASFDWSLGIDLMLRTTMIMLPYMPLICLVAVYGAVLQVHGRFASTAAVPVVLNVVIIGATLLGARLFDDKERVVYIVSFAVVASGVLQLLWQVVAVVRVERIMPTLSGAAEPMREMLRRFVPMAIGLGIFQINTFFDQALAAVLRVPEDGVTTFTLFKTAIAYPLNEGDVAALGWAQRLYEFPLGVFGIAIATAIFPAMARAAARSREEMREILQHGLRLTVFIGVPASAGLILAGLPLVKVIFQRGEFDADDSLVVAGILLGYAPAIWAYSMNHVITRAFYSLGDTRTPLISSTAMVVLNLVLNLTFVWHFHAAGFAWSTALCSMLQSVVLLLVIRRYIQQPVDRYVCLGWLRTVLLTVVMSIAVYLVRERVASHSAYVQLAVLVAVGMSVFAIGAWVTRAAELRWLLKKG